MVAESKFTEKEGESKRQETLDLNLIDTDYIEKRIRNDLSDFQTTHNDFFKERRDWLLAMRDLRYQHKQGYFEDASDLHIPYSLIMKKAMHSRIFQVFSQRNFFSIESNNAVFQENEELIQNFMNWVMGKWMNRGRGKADVIDTWLDNILEEGTGILKLWWDNWEYTFVDLDIETEEVDVPDIVAGLDIEVETKTETKTRIKNVKKTRKEAAPASATVALDDFFMPPGQLNVQQSPWIAHRVYLQDEDLKLRAQQKKFDKEMVEEALERRNTSNSSVTDRDSSNTLKQDMRQLEGVSDTDSTSNDDSATHVVYEWYGRAYVEKEVDEGDFKST